MTTGNSGEGLTVHRFDELTVQKTEGADYLSIATPAHILVNLGSTALEIKIASSDQRSSELEFEHVRDAPSMRDLMEATVLKTAWEAHYGRVKFEDEFGYWPSDVDDHTARFHRPFIGVLVPVHPDIEIQWIMRREPEVQTHVLKTLGRTNPTIIDKMTSVDWPGLISFPICAEASIIKFAAEH